MTSRSECAQMRISLGVYVLGAIEPAERTAVDTHLNACQRCRDELASLAGLPAMLGRISQDQVEQLGPPPEELLDSILTQAAGETRTQRHKNRLRLVGAAAALIAVTGVGVGVGVGTHQGGRGTVAKPPASAPPSSWNAEPATTVRGNDSATGVQAQIVMQPKQWGTAFSVWLNGAPYGARCQLIAIDKHGKTDVAGGWEVGYVGGANFAGSSMFQKEDIASLEVRTLDGRKLLRIPM